MNDPMVTRTADSRSTHCFANALVAASLWIMSPTEAKTPQEIFAEASPSIVVVEVSDAAGTVEATGSGVVIAKGEVITNCHVAAEGKMLRIKLGNALYPATTHYADRDRDLCQLSAPKLVAPPVIMGDVKSLRPGARVVAIGAPEGLELSISEGLISALRDYGDGSKIIQTTAPISPGSSGGGLFDESGSLIGFTTFFLKEGQNLNFALPVSWVAELPRHVSPQTDDKSTTLEWLAMSSALEKKGDWKTLFYFSTEWAKEEPKNASAWFSLGRALDNLDQHTKAVDAFRESLRINPMDAVAWYDLGVAYTYSLRYDEAIVAYREALRIDPNDSQAWTNLCYAYEISNQYAKAIEACREAIRIDPKNAVAWENLGKAYGESRQYTREIEAQRAALRIDPKDGSLWFNLGVAYGDLHKYAQAIEAYREALRINPKDADAWLNLGLSYSLQGNHSGLIEAYKSLRALDPEKADKLFDLAIAPH